MNISISTYQVQKGDTLESVSEQFGISGDALKRYHNTYCNLNNLIGNNLLGVQDIIIPLLEKIIDIRQNQESSEKRNHLPPTPAT